MAVMMHPLVDKTVSAIFESVELEIRLQQTPDKIVQSSGYSVKVTEVLLNTKELLEQVANVVRTKSHKEMDISSKIEDRIKRFVQAAE